MRSRCLPVCALALLASCGAPASSPPTATVAPAALPHASLAVVHVLAFDGRQTVDDATVLVDGARIVAVTAHGAVPASARVVEGRGKTLLPGLIDAHVHLHRPEDLREMAVFGVTTALDMFAFPETVAAAKRLVQTGSGVADLRSSGILATAPGGHGTEYGFVIPTIARPEEAEAFVEARVREGSDYLKVVFDDASGYGMHNPTLSTETLRALVVAAHRRHLLVVAHIGTQEGARVALEAGVDGLAHTFEDSAPAADFAALAVDASAAGAHGELADDPALQPFLTRDERKNLHDAFPRSTGSHLQYPFAEASVAALHAAGVSLLAGTDAPNPGTAYGASLHDEMARLVHAGLTPAEALTAATFAPAAAFGLRDRGRLAPGLRADLLLVDGDATRDIRATRAIARVWIGGVEIDRASYRQEVETENARAAAAPPARVVEGPIGDFESASLDTPIGVPWKELTDVVVKGTSEVSVRRVSGGAHGSQGAMEIQGELRAGAGYPFAGAMLAIAASPTSPVDLKSTGKTGIAFRVKGDGHPASLMLYTMTGGWLPAVQTFPTSKEWREVHLSFAGFKTDGHDVTGIAFTGGPKLGKFRFVVDDVAFE